MKAIFIYEGKSIDYVPAADVAAGDVVVIGDIVGVAQFDIPKGTLGAVALTRRLAGGERRGGGDGGREGLLERDRRQGDRDGGQ